MRWDLEACWTFPETVDRQASLHDEFSIRAVLVQHDGTAFLFVIGFKMKRSRISLTAHRTRTFRSRWLRTLPNAQV
jgi:hypothetical protein